MKRRLAIVAGLGAVWVVSIAARLYQLQVVRYDHYAAKAEKQQQRVITLDPPRGTIYDAAGRELAVSVQVDSAYAVPSAVTDKRATARALARVLVSAGGPSAKKLERLLASDREFVWVARKLDPPVAHRLRALNLPGIAFLPESKRYYPMRELAAQVLGWVGTDNVGLAGIEQEYDKVVAGKPGARTVLRDARRGTVVAPDLSFADPEPGQDLYLTLDAAIQHVVERELARAVTARGAARGTAVFLDPATGGVLAMATYPAFDPNEFCRYPEARWRNRAIADVFEPGSTFKIITAAAALEAEVVEPNDVFDCELGGITLLGVRIRDHKPFGQLTFAEVIAKSSNVGVIKAALLLGGERLHGTIRAFGFGRPTGIDLPGESAGIVHPYERWRPLAKAYIAFGQGISVTSLQLASAAAAVANGGRLLRPYVVAATGRGGSRLARHRSPPMVGHPIRPETASELTALLEGVVTSGTGRSAATAGYRVAGKTGTAQIPVAGGYSQSGYYPAFVGFAPADRPVLVGVVAIAEPRGAAYHGGQVAAPVFAAIARQVLLDMGVRPERERPWAWPGEVATASLHPAPDPATLGTPPAAGEPPTDGDDLDRGAPELLWHDPPPESLPKSPKSGGGRQRAPV